MKVINWETTIAGLATAIINITILFGFDLTPEQTLVVISSATTIGLFVVSVLAKDKNVTGGTKPQTYEARRRT